MLGNNTKYILLVALLALTTQARSDDVESILRSVTSAETPKNEDAAIEDRAKQVTEPATSTPAYPSTPEEIPESKTFTGSYKPARTVAVSIFSDDGFDISVNDSVIMDRLSEGQALPDFTQSYHLIEKDEKPLILEKDTTYSLSISYKNIAYKKDSLHPDVDGITVYLFDPVLQSASVSGDIPDDQDEYSEYGWVMSHNGSSLGLLPLTSNSKYANGAILFTGRVSKNMRKYTYGVERYIRVSKTYLQTPGEAMVSSTQTNKLDASSAAGSGPVSGGLDGTADTPTGNIYDYDDPGPLIAAINLFSNGTLFAYRLHFEQWFTVGDKICSEKIKWHFYRTLQKTSAGVVIVSPDDPKKNSIGVGWDSLDY